MGGNSTLLAHDDGLLLQANRQRIYETITAHPGLHLRALERQLQMPLGTLEYHLHQMCKAGLVHVRAFGRLKAFFTAVGTDRRDRDLLYYLRLGTPRRVLLELVRENRSAFSVLAGRIPVAPSTLSFHLKKLVAAGLVAQEREDGKTSYVCLDPERVRRLLVEHKASLVDDAVDRFADAWLNL